MSTELNRVQVHAFPSFPPFWVSEEEFQAVTGSLRGRQHIAFTHEELIKSKTESGSNVFVSGIDSLYVNHFEKINVVKGSEEGLNKVLNENANSILMPEIFAASSDIGKTIKINME